VKFTHQINNIYIIIAYCCMLIKFHEVLRSRNQHNWVLLILICLIKVYLFPFYDCLRLSIQLLLQYLFHCNVFIIPENYLHANIVLLGNLSSVYQTLRRKYGMQYHSRCNIFNSFGNPLLIRYVYKGRPEKNIAQILHFHLTKKSIWNIWY